MKSLLTSLLDAISRAFFPLPDSGLIECTGCRHVGTLEQRTRRQAPPEAAAPLVCSKCGCETYFKLDIQGRRIR